MKKSFAMKYPAATLAAGLCSLVAFYSATAQTPPTEATGASTNRAGDAIARIRDEGMNHSQAMKTLSYLSDVIGPRLTGSPNLKRANEWTRDELTSLGLSNAHLEGWTFGRGWELKRFSAQVIEPQDIPLKAFPSAWSPGFDKPIEADVIYLDATNSANLDKYRGKLKGTIVLMSPVRQLTPRFDPLARRYTDTNLQQLATATSGNVDVLTFGLPGGRGGGGARGGANTPSAGTNAPARGGRGGRGGGGGGAGGAGNLAFLAREGVALVVTSGGMADGGTFSVSSASVPPASGTNAPAGGQRMSPYSLNAPDFPAQMVVAVEDYNRMVRMIQAGQKLKMAVELQVAFHSEDPMTYNTIAEIPGTDLKDEIVMIGGHMDSWHAGTGATDNGTGVAAAMEAVRILKAAGLQPRRTIRVGLWAGEEQGLLGSRAYVTKHLGYYTNRTEARTDGGTNGAAASAGSGGGQAGARGRGANGGGGAGRELVRLPEYEKLSVYFNLDNGAGRIRGIYAQGNPAARTIFQSWLEPFRDLDATTVTIETTGSTDHISFDNIGLPGFQFIQDPLDYGTRTHHTNEDVVDRVPAEDMKQNATIMAAFAYNAAMLETKIPRKPAE